MSTLHIHALSARAPSTTECLLARLQYMDPSIKADVSCMNCCRRFLSGEHCVTGEYVNTSTLPAIIGFTPAIPARVIPLDLKNGPVQCKSGAWFISLGNADVTCEPDCNPFTCCCAGQGCIRQTVQGDGTAFLAAMGTLMKKELAPGEVFVIDTNSLVAWDKTATLSARRAGGCCMCCCGGEGCFNTTLTGPGTAYIQSMSWDRFKRAMKVHVRALYTPN